MLSIKRERVVCVEYKERGVCVMCVEYKERKSCVC